MSSTKCFDSAHLWCQCGVSCFPSHKIDCDYCGDRSCLDEALYINVGNFYYIDDKWRMYIAKRGDGVPGDRCQILCRPFEVFQHWRSNELVLSGI